MRATRVQRLQLVREEASGLELLAVRCRPRRGCAPTSARRHRAGRRALWGGPRAAPNAPPAPPAAIDSSEPCAAAPARAGSDDRSAPRAGVRSEHCGPRP